MNAIPYPTFCFMLSGHLLPFTLLTCRPVEQRKHSYSFTHIIIEGQLKNTLNYSYLFIAFVCFCQNLRRTWNLSRFWLQTTLYVIIIWLISHLKKLFGKYFPLFSLFDFFHNFKSVRFLKLLESFFLYFFHFF